MEGSFLNKFSPSSPKKLKLLRFLNNRSPGFFPPNPVQPREKPSNPSQIALSPWREFQLPRYCFPSTLSRVASPRLPYAPFLFVWNGTDGEGALPQSGGVVLFLLESRNVFRRWQQRDVHPKNCGNFGWVLVKSKV